MPRFSDARWTGNQKHTARKLRRHWAHVNHPATVLFLSANLPGNRFFRTSPSRKSIIAK